VRLSKVSRTASLTLVIYAQDTDITGRADRYTGLIDSVMIEAEGGWETVAAYFSTGSPVDIPPINVQFANGNAPIVWCMATSQPSLLLHLVHSRTKTTPR
jgi:hypothetical protein